MLCFRSKQLATLLILGSAPLLAQNPEAAAIVREGSIATLSVDHPRLLDAIAIALAETYQFHVNAEDPEYLYAGDIRDVTAQVARVPNPQRRVLVPRGGSFHLSYPVDAGGRPVDAAALLRRIVNAFNGQFKTRYRLAEDGDVYTFIPVRTRNSRGRMAARPPLLDHRISLPYTNPERDFPTHCRRAIPTDRSESKLLRPRRQQLFSASGHL